MSDQPIDQTTSSERSSRPHKGIGKAGRIAGMALLLVLVTAAAIGFAIRLGERRALGKETESLAVPNVIVIQPKAAPPQEEIVLPSSLEAFTESPIYARTNGYLAHWYKDIGSKVQKGTLLADIETPEIDQELMQARAARDQAEAQLRLAKTSALPMRRRRRWRSRRQHLACARRSTSASGMALNAARYCSAWAARCGTRVAGQRPCPPDAEAAETARRARRHRALRAGGHRLRGGILAPGPGRRDRP